jgi:hypothetical protein
MFTIPAGAFPKKEMEKAQIRLNRTLLKIFAKIVENLLVSEDKGSKTNPYRIKAFDIDSDNRSKNKTMQILRSAGALPPAQSEEDKSSWYLSTHYTTYYDYEKFFKEHSEGYAEPIVFPDIPNEIESFLKSDCLNHFHTDKESLDLYGYKTFPELCPSHKIYLYYHQDLYNIIKQDVTHKLHEKLMIYPKTLIETRTKAVLKALMRMYCEEDMLSYLKRKFDLDLTGQEQFREEYNTNFDITLRNFSRHPITFSESCFKTASKSYIKEYNTNVDKINFEYNRLKALVDKLNEGCGSVLEDYIKESVDNLVGKAPTLINGGENDRDALEYILDHRDLITYDYLYK